ncbi:MAG: DNA adenine methylase [Candidatus Hydrogenedentes bacterium]|nr:DNA adenine methylase [Candidatus Hydrogenedentota bacterium]
MTGLGGAIPAKPFLKWAGGKGQLLGEIRARLPVELAGGGITRYIEPFVGGGAVLFDLIQANRFQDIFIFDLNRDLICVYRVVQRAVESLILRLQEITHEYHSLNPVEQDAFYYNARTEFNATRDSIRPKRIGDAEIDRASKFIFLNKTCYNGLYRVNSEGDFNVPFGFYVRPNICDEHNLRVASRVLQGVSIQTGDFAMCESFVTSDTFIYLDPPYRPLSDTANFNAYTGTNFDDASQQRLAALFQRFNDLGAKLMLSNSDPKNENPNDHFFEDAYAGFHISRVAATRRINSDAAKRGNIYELIITNYSQTV